MTKSFKLFSLIAFFGLCSFFTKTTAQVDVTINPIGLLWGDLNAGADFMLSDNLSVEAALGFGTGDSGGQDWRNIGVTGVGKYYFNPDDGADKFYADVFLRFVNRKWDSNDFFGSSKQTRVGIGFGIGYKAVANNGLVFDIGIGAGRALVDNITYDVEGESYEVDWIKLMFNGKLGIGYRFGGK